MKELYASVTGCSNILSVVYSNSHSAQCATVTIETESTTLDIGDEVSVDIGYTDDHALIFTGYVKDIQLKEPERFYTISLSDVMIRAAEYYIVSANPETPMTRNNIDAALLIRDVLAVAGITDFDYELTNFMLGVYYTVEINLVTAYDYAHSIASLIAWNLWADIGGGVNFYRRMPWPTEEDTPLYTLYPATEGTSIVYTMNDDDLRNRVVLYGAAGIYAEASEESPYLPEGYYKTAAVSAPQVVDSQEMADLSVAYNLELYNKLTHKLELAIEGNPHIIPRQVVTVVYPNMDNISADWYVFATEHAWGKGGYTTTLELRRYTEPE